MLNPKKIFIICIVYTLIFNLNSISGQSRVIDSLLIALSKTKHDTSIINTYLAIGEQFKKSNPDTSIYFNTQAKNLAIKINDQLRKGEAIRAIGWNNYILGNSEKAMELFNEALIIAEKNNTSNNSEIEFKSKKLQANTLGNIGLVLKDKGEHIKAIENFNKALSINQSINNKNGIASNLGNLGIVYYEESNYALALDHYFKALKISEELENKQLQANNLGNIGGVYKDLNDLTKSLEYYQKALNLSKATNNKLTQVINLGNIANVHSIQGNFNKALDYYFEALKLNTDLGRKNGILSNLSGIAVIFYYQGEYLKAKEYYLNAIELSKELENNIALADNLSNLGSNYIKLKKYNDAEKFIFQGLEIAKQTNYLHSIKNDYHFLFELYKQTKKYALALDYYEKYISIRDSIVSQENQKVGIKKELQFQFEKQAAADSVAHSKESEIKNAEIAKQTAEIKAKKNQQYALYGGLALVMVFAGFMYNRFKITQKQKGIIELQKSIVEEQKHLVEEKQKELLDSIHYAKRIQQAQIPSDKQVHRMLSKLKR